MKVYHKKAARYCHASDNRLQPPEKWVKFQRPQKSLSPPDAVTCLKK